MMLADAVARYRRENNLSLAELAAQLEMSESGLQWVECGAVVPRLSTFRRIARLLQWTPEEAAIVFLDLPDESPRLTIGQSFGHRAAALQKRAARDESRAQQTGPGIGGRDLEPHHGGS